MNRRALSTFAPLTLAARALLVTSAGLVVACGGSKNDAETPADSKTTTTQNMNAALADAPEWVLGDCRNSFKGQAVLCGVGAVSGVSSPSLARNTAMARGRTEIARYLQVDVKSVLTDYQAAKGGVVEQQIEDQSQQIADMTLSGTRMAKYWVGKDGTYYALMALELEAYSSALQSAQNIEPPLRDALVERARKSFSSRDTEVSRY
jgi:hypothetical protein